MPRPTTHRRREGLALGLALGLAGPSIACSPSTSRTVVSADGPQSIDHPMSTHGHGHAGGPHPFSDAETWTKVFDDPERDAWQRPDDVVQALSLAPTMVVADVGAGTGYFAVRLARAVPEGEVIATDLAPDMVRFLEERARRDGITNLRALQASETASGLPADSVDRVLVVNVWHHIADREAYARDLAAALRPGGRLLVVEFDLAADRGPPAEMRLPPERVIADLQAAGLVASLSPVELPEQYLVEARRGDQ